MVLAAVHVVLVVVAAAEEVVVAVEDRYKKLYEGFECLSIFFDKNINSLKERRKTQYK